MAGLNGGCPWALAAALALAATVLAALYGVQRRRVARLAARMEDFLSGGGKALEFSVREDGFAPLHNAAAELENRLLLAREQLREETRRTGDLIADISHQLKTPLASLRLFVEMDGGAHGEVALTQIERMERLIYSLLRLERLCADGYAFAFQECDAGEIVQAAWDSLAAVHGRRRLRILGSARLRCDEKWLGEAFANLLKNACQHTGPEGQIEVRLEGTPNAFYASVSDDGGGVDAKELPHLFERFYRAGNRETGGAGIGLAIVREIVGRHHGSVQAENGEKGLKISMTLPILNLAKS